MKHSKEKQARSSVVRIIFRNILLVFSVLLVFFAIFFVITLTITNASTPNNGERVIPLIIIFVLLVLSSGLGILLTTFGALKLSKPLEELERATEEIAKGNFDVQVSSVKNEEINQFIQNFNKMARELKNNEVLKTDFISNISHEFKTPLTVIQSYSKALAGDDIDEQTRKHYQQVLDINIKKLISLTSNILSLSKIENQEIIANKSEFLLDEQIRETLLELEPQWQKKNIEFDLRLPTTQYYGANELLYQVWQNIIGNAIKFSHDGGKITISLATSERQVIVHVKDEGIGMSKEVQKHIFDKFYQADTSHSGDGNGLGLALVSRIVNVCGGTIVVNSEENKGSEFVITLPESTK